MNIHPTQTGTAGSYNFHYPAVFFSSSSPDHTNGQNNWAWVPDNIFGLQFTLYSNQSDISYAAIEAGARHNTYYNINAREYLIGAFDCNLIAGEDYKVSFYASYCDNSGYAVKNLGAYIDNYYSNWSTSPYVYGYNGYTIMKKNSSGVPQQITPQIYHNTFLTDDNHWTQINGTFHANGGEDAIYIGCFEDPNDTNYVKQYRVNTTGNNNKYTYEDNAYYYIDHVSVRLIPKLTASAYKVCSGDQVTLTASPGFDNYNWYKGLSLLATTNVNQYNVTPTATTTYTVEMIKGNCTMTLDTTIQVSDITLNTVGNISGCFAGTTYNFQPGGNPTAQGGFYPYQYNWVENLPNNMSTFVSSSSNPSIMLPIPSNSTFTLVVTDFIGCTNSTTITANLSAKNKEPIITGNNNNCGGMLYTYHLDNYDNSKLYLWTIINGSGNIIGSNTLDSCVINWLNIPSLPNAAIIKVTISNTDGSCLNSSTFKVFECCEGDIGGGGLYWHDTVFTSPQYFYNQYIIINGTIVLKDTLSLTNSTNWNGGIWFGPQAKIVLDSGGYFEGNYIFLDRACDYMWDGVYANSKNEVVKIHTTTVENAVNGIVSENGAPLYLDTCYFDNNLRSVQIKNYRRTSFFQNPVYYNGHIRGCSFNTDMGDPNYAANYYTLLSPHQNDPSECGIYIENVEDIQIGDSNTLKNTFNRSRFGIISNNSALKVYNNEFRYINDVTNTGWFSFIQGAVFVSNINTSFPTLNYSKAMDIGKAGNASNYFNNCHTALFANNTIARVSNNIVDSCNVGFRLLDFKYHSRIDSNEINHTTEGILVHKPIGGNRNIKIRENNLPYSTELKTGISIINVNSSYGDIAQIANNTIHFLGNQNLQHYGIITQGCNGIKVNSNNIGRGGVSLSNIVNNWDKMIGIKTAQSQGCQITDNYIYSMGTGIWTNGSCNLTEYTCNDIIAYKYGFYFGQLSTISEQGQDSIWNTHNKWSTSGVIAGNQKLATDANYSNFNWSGDVKWYYGPNYIAQYIPIYLGIPTRRILPSQNSTDNHYCVGTTTGTGTSTGGGSPTGGGTNSGTLAMLEDENIDPEVRDFLLEDIMQGLDYVDLLNEFRAYDAKFLYEMLATDTSLMWLGGENDIDYQEFFDSIRMSNIGDFTKVYDLIEAEDYHRADSMNNLIVPTSDIYTNLQTVLSIYLNSWCKGNYLLSETDYNILFEIANQTPYEGGDGVYTARIMINYNPDDYGVAFRLKPESVKDADKDAIKLYPNPAQDRLNIEFENPTGDEINGVLKVFNLSGQLIFERQLNTTNAYYVLDISSLTNGAYIFSIQINNTENTAYRYQSGKLIVLKP